MFWSLITFGWSQASCSPYSSHNAKISQLDAAWSSIFTVQTWERYQSLNLTLAKKVISKKKLFLQEGHEKIKCTNRNRFTFRFHFSFNLYGDGWLGKPTNHTQSLDALETLVISPYAAIHMGHFLILTRGSFLLLFLPESLVVLSPRPFVPLWISPFIHPSLLSRFFISNSPSLYPTISHTSSYFSTHPSIFCIFRFHSLMYVSLSLSLCLLSSLCCQLLIAGIKCPNILSSKMLCFLSLN